MRFNVAGLLLCTILVGCGGGDAPFGEEDTDTDTDGGTGTGTETTTDETGIEREGIPPGTESPTASTQIVRTEPTAADGGNDGDGFLAGVRYDGPTTSEPDRDRFVVDGLAFDGGNRYARGTTVSSLNGGEYAVYEAFQQFPDSLNGNVINQLTHRAIYGVSRNTDAEGNPNTQFAIVRTGSYVGYGFGGFIYQRDNSVTLPSSGQALYNGTSAGLRDFDGRGGLEYATSNVELAIDFEDFDSTTGARGDAVRATFSDRRVFDLAGNDITSAVVARINTKNEASLTDIPDARFTIGPGVLDDNGDLIGTLSSAFTNDEGEAVEYETGSYYAIVSGDNAEEIVGVFVAENSAEFDGATVRDTSGFIVHRDPTPVPAP